MVHVKKILKKKEKVLSCSFPVNFDPIKGNHCSDFFLSQIMFSYSRTSYKGNNIYVAFGVWLLSLRTELLRFILFVSYINNLLLSIVEHLFHYIDVLGFLISYSITGHLGHFQFLKNFIEVQLIYNVLISTIQQSDSYIYIYIHTLFFIFLFHYGLSQDVEYSSQCYTVGPCFLPILYITLCIS